jgi:hypothetical protein
MLFGFFGHVPRVARRDASQLTALFDRNRRQYTLGRYVANSNPLPFEHCVMILR